MKPPKLAAPGRAGRPGDIQPGGLGSRFVALLIDTVAPALLVAALIAVAVDLDATAGRVAVTIAAALGICWALLVCWMSATRAAGPGMRLMKLRLVGLPDGRPIGWARYLARSVVWWVLTATGIGAVGCVVLLLRHPRRQGPHDVAVDSIVVRERPPHSNGEAASEGQALELGGEPAESLERGYPEPGDQQRFAQSHPYPPASYPPAAELPMTQPPLVPPSILSPPFSIQTPTTDYRGGSASPTTSAATEPVSAAASGPVAGDSPMPTDGRTAKQGWIAVLDDGRQIEVEGVVLLGRNPRGRPGEDDAQLIKIADATRTVSKTHLALGADAHGMYVMDRGSTNGSTVTSAGGVCTPCPPGDIIEVQEGNIVSIGDHWLEIRRAHPNQ